MTTNEQQLRDILFAYALSAQQRVQTLSKRMVHYTSAEVAVSILRRREVWMRNALAMNDYSEVQHGERCLRHAWHNEHGQKLKNLLTDLYPNMGRRLEEAHDTLQQSIRSHAYILCVSEHEDHEDTTGRLSMWRAYGGNTGVAIVFRNQVMFGENPSAKVFVSPIAYYSEQDFNDDFGKVVDKLIKSQSYTRCSEEFLAQAILQAFHFATLSTKHPGFHEEKEWRLIYTDNGLTPHAVTKAIEVIGDVPQIVHKISLQDLSNIDRIIIGPSKFPLTLRDAFVHILKEANVTSSHSKVVLSEIPLRR